MTPPSPEPVDATSPEPVEGTAGGGTSPGPVEGPQEPTDPEDRKIITLARAARARIQADQGACVRDTDGRTYAATSVRLEHLSLSAISVAVAMAVSSGAAGLEAVAVSADGEPSRDDLDVVRDLPGTGVVVWCTDAQGRVRSTIGL
jgi:hypothetical protein